MGWIDFVNEAKFENESRMNYAATALLRGEFIFRGKYTYFLLGTELIDVE